MNLVAFIAALITAYFIVTRSDALKGAEDRGKVFWFIAITFIGYVAFSATMSGDFEPLR